MQSRQLRSVIDGPEFKWAGFGVEAGRFPKVLDPASAIEIVLVDHATLLRRIKTWVPAPSPLPHWRRLKELAAPTPAIRHCLEPFRHLKRPPDGKNGPKYPMRPPVSSRLDRFKAGGLTLDDETNVSGSEYSMGLDAILLRTDRKENGSADGRWATPFSA